MILFSKNGNLLMIALAAIIVAGCGDTLTESSTQTFTQPQPVNTKTLLQFPDQLQGKYLSLNDSSFISIGNNFIVRVYESWEISIMKNLILLLYRRGILLLKMAANKSIRLYDTKIVSLFIFIYRIQL